MRCKTCHYSLENLAEHRCPECGNAFDPDDPQTYDAVRTRKIRDIAACAGIAAAMSLGVFAWMISEDVRAPHMTKAETLVGLRFFCLLFFFAVFTVIACVYLVVTHIMSRFR